MKRNSLLLGLAAALCGFNAAAVTPLWMRDVKISPDGSTIAFCYMGDIWTVPAGGGHATRLTVTPDDYEATPVWSPDSRSIAYQTDVHGNFDVYIMNADGTGQRRLTYNSASETPESFTPDGKGLLFSASIQAPDRSAMFPSSRMTQLYEVNVDGDVQMPVQKLGTPARFISWAPDGKSFVYQDVKGFEDEWRKHHTSSVTRDVWRYDVRSGKHTNLTKRGGEDLNPVCAGKDIYYLSERDGRTINVYRAPGGNFSAPEAVTDFKVHPVRFLSRAADGTLCFTYDGEIYTLQQGAPAPSRLAVTLDAPAPEQVWKMSSTSAASDAVPSPDGKMVAFINHGNLFVTSVEYPTTKQITATAEAEYDPTWSKDSRTLYFTSEMDGPYNIYKATMTRGEEEYDFPNATLISIEPMFAADGVERTVPRVSPDGKQLAFITDRNRLCVMDLDTKAVRQLTDGSFNPREQYGFNYSWSPDSKWIALEVSDHMHHPYGDIGIIEVATGKMTNLTQSGYFDEQPRWVLGGDAILFLSERYGMRNHASWGSQSDVMIQFLNQKAYDRFRMSKEELEIAEKMDKKDDKKKDEKEGEKKDDKKKDGDKKKKGDKKKDGDKKDDDKKDDDKSQDINVELDGIADRVLRLTPMSASIVDAVIPKDGENLYYLTSGDGTQLWKVGLRETSFRLAGTKVGSGRFHVTPDGKTIFLLGSALKKFDPSGERFTGISFKADYKLDNAAEREYMFDYVTREERERFYIADMHGVDWPMMTEAYRKFLPHINNNYDFAELLSEMLGELNVSHTGGRYRNYSTSQSDRTATLGLLYDLNYKGKGVKVAEVIEGGPFDRAGSKMKAGAVITAINGREVTPTDDLTRQLCDLGGKNTLVTFNDGKTSVDETVKPISAGTQSNLLYNRWVKQRAADVDRLSGGRLGYVHIESMDDDSFRKVYSDLLGKYNTREGVVIDIRWNGGGRLHEDIEVLFSGNKYFTQVLRGTPTCDMPSRRWNKPSIMLMAESCYSNAHGTPWVYKNRNLGKLVGMPVPGTMTSVNWVTMQDPTLVFGIPVIGYELPDGSYLENSQLEPDILVANDPAVIVTGRDQQLEAAVKALLEQIDAEKKADSNTGKNKK